MKAIDRFSTKYLPVNKCSIFFVSGIGYETSLELAKRGARVILACRDQQRGSAAVESIKRLTENENVTLKLLDLASFKSINNFVDDIIKNKTKIDVLVNNAGAWGLGDKLSEDGLQMEWQINHYGPVLLTLRLLGKNLRFIYLFSYSNKPFGLITKLQTIYI